MGDDELDQHVQAVLDHLNDPASGRRWKKVAPFITADVLMRFHNLVASARRAQNRCGGWTKQATLARVVGCFTGIDVKMSDAEYIGNAQDYYLKQYTKMLSKANHADTMRVHRAKKSGRDLPAASDANANRSSRVHELKTQIYKCKFGGVPRNIIFERDAENIPVRKYEHADVVNQRLQKEILSLKQSHVDKPEVREMRHNLNALCAAVEAAREARQQAEQHVAELEAANMGEAQRMPQPACNM